MINSVLLLHRVGGVGVHDEKLSTHTTLEPHPTLSLMINSVLLLHRVGGVGVHQEHQVESRQDQLRAQRNRRFHKRCRVSLTSPVKTAEFQTSA